MSSILSHSLFSEELFIKFKAEILTLMEKPLPMGEEGVGGGVFSFVRPYREVTNSDVEAGTRRLLMLHKTSVRIIVECALLEALAQVTKDEEGR